MCLWLPITRFRDENLQGVFGTFHQVHLKLRLPSMEIGKYHVLSESGQLSDKMRHNTGFQLVRTGSRGSLRSFFEAKVFFISSINKFHVYCCTLINVLPQKVSKSKSFNFTNNWHERHFVYNFFLFFRKNFISDNFKFWKISIHNKRLHLTSSTYFRLSHKNRND